jgi:tetratricopeptide (TPR) repeat protein
VALGHRLSALARYEEAIAEFRRAYEQRADPRFLYHIAESYRQLGSKQQAIFYYDRYLIGAPKAPDREEVEQRIADLGGMPGRSVRPRPRLLLEPSEEVQVTAQPSPWRRWWFWTAVGVTLAAGVTAAVLASRPSDGPPATELGSMRFF